MLSTSGDTRDALIDAMVDEAKQRGAFIYAPQATSTWSSTTITSQVMTMIDRAINTLNADTHRIYITGYSQGSHGTWMLLSRYDGRFAAAVGGSLASSIASAATAPGSSSGVGGGGFSGGGGGGGGGGGW